jgi:thiamine monophosphate synthase
MEHNHGNPLLAAISLIITFFSSIFAMISLANMQAMATMAASGIAIVSGVFAARYYYYAAKEKKEVLKNLSK